MLRRYVVLAAVALGGACSDALERTSSAGQVIAAVDSITNTVWAVSATDASVFPLDLRTSAATPGSIAAVNDVLVVPLGQIPAVAVLRVPPPCGSMCSPTPYPVTTIDLPAGSGATGVAIERDSVAWVANPALGTVTRVNYITPDTASVRVGVTPVAVAVAAGRVYVVNANLTGGAPAGPSWVTVINAATRARTDSIALLGVFARAATLGGDGFLYVVDAGHPGRSDGKLSIVDTTARTEVAVLNGLGESPGPAVFHPSGRLLIASLTEGILEVYTPTRSLTRGAGNGIKPGGHGVSGLAIDLRGRVYALDPNGCATQGSVHVLQPPPDYTEIRSVPVGRCPSAAAVATTP